MHDKSWSIELDSTHASDVSRDISTVQYEERRYLGLDFLIDRVDVQEEEVCQCTLVLLCIVHDTTRSDRSSPSGIRQVVNAESILKLSLSEGFHSRGVINTTAF